jgi:hypothetical protein
MKLSWKIYKDILDIGNDSNNVELLIFLYESFFDGDANNMGIKMLISKVKPILEVIKLTKKYTQLKNEINVDALVLKYKSIYEMSLGEYIDLEHFLNKKDFTKILTIVYRKKAITDIDKDVWEDWGGYSNKRINLFDDIDAAVCLGAINNIIEERNEFLDKHKSIFSQDIEEEKVDFDELDQKEKKLIEQEENNEKIKKALNFEFLIHTITRGDVLKIENALRMNVDLLFKFLLVDKQHNLIFKK